MRIALLLLVACGSTAVPPPPPPLRPDPEPRPVSPSEDAVVATPTLLPPAPPPDPEPRTLHGFPGLDLVESPNSVMHEHGGDAAKIRVARLQFNVLDRRAHQIEARSIEFLRRSCNETTWHSRKKLDITGYSASWDNPGAARGETIGRTELVLPAGVPRRALVSIRFKPVEAYQACDVFGFALDIVVDRVRHVFELPLDVTRIEPIE